MSTISRELRTTAIFKCIVTLKNGFHKTLRMQVNKVAQLVAALKQMKQMPWLNNRYESLFREYDIDYRQISGCRFINERTGEELLSIA